MKSNKIRILLDFVKVRGIARKTLAEYYIVDCV